MKGIIALFAFVCLFAFCSVDDSKSDDSGYVSAGACVVTTYANYNEEGVLNYDTVTEYCYNNKSKSDCDSYIESDSNDNGSGWVYTWDTYSDYYKESNCPDEGYTKGCGGSFVSDDETCPGE